LSGADKEKTAVLARVTSIDLNTIHPIEELRLCELVLTRGLRGCCIYSVDPRTRTLLLELIH
jgi:DUF2075 family protein